MDNSFFENLPLNPLVLLAGVLGLLLLCAVCLLLWRRRRGEEREPEPEEYEQPVGTPLPPPQTEEEERLLRLEETVSLQKTQIDELERQLADAVKVRHDFRQQLLLLQEFARSGNREALDRYLPQIKLEGSALSVPLCPNPLVNTMLRFYVARARAADVEVNAVIQADENLWLSAADVSVLFGNLLENAVTAASEAPAGKRRIRIRTTQTDDFFVIAMGNTFGTPRAVSEEGIFSSTKPEHTGVGLGSIRALALRYDGEAKFLLDGDTFMSYVILLRPLPEQQAKPEGSTEL